MKEKDYPFIFWVHILVIGLSYTSPFFLNWKWIGGILLLWYVQMLVLGSCILTEKQFGKDAGNKTFFWHYIEKMGLKWRYNVVMVVADYIIPCGIFVFAIFWQVYLKHIPPRLW